MSDDLEVEVEVEVEGIGNEESISKSSFRLAVAHFAFQSPQTSPLRKSAQLSRNSQGQSDGTKSNASSVTASRSTPMSKKRTFATSAVESETESPTKHLKRKRGYAGPEVYAHLDYLTDCMAEYLDVLFCGINPGVYSSTVGHHFAHPRNAFYKMLHGSGFTDRLVSPNEDSTLPGLYQIGITDLVDRPSSCENELSSAEMIESVPQLLRKVTRYKPRFVCFIGKGMWQQVEKGFRRVIVEGDASIGVGKPASASPRPRSPESPRKQKGVNSPTRRAGKSSEKSTDSGVGLRPYKVTHSDISSPVRETLFFCSHSSSGLATSMNLQGKIDVLRELRAMVAQHKNGTLETSAFNEVPV